MSLSRVEVVTEESQSSGCPKLCVFCKSSRLNELKYGPMYHLKDTITHYFCLLFSAGLNQLGKDYEGILGFMLKDIQKEVGRSSRLRCYYCKEVGASIGCCNRRCRKMFHYPCGLKNSATYQFFGNFESYCPAHAKTQKITLKEAEWVCPVCMGQVLRSEHPVQASCCSAAVFHKDCMQKVALNAGYFFKCPTCNASQNFVQEMRSVGIYVPEQDASWEREPDAFGELLYQYSVCDASECDCSRGRDYTSEEGPWSYARCRVCGAAGVHKKCGKVDDIDDWACSPCIEMEKNAEKEKQLKQAQFLKSKTEAEEAERQRREEMLELTDQEADSDETDDFQMSDIIISSRCYHYFPYDKKELSRFQKNQCIPDWRNLHLAVDVVKWLTPVEVLEAAAKRSREQGNNPGIPSSSLKNNTLQNTSQVQLPRKRGRKRKVPCETVVRAETEEAGNMCSGEENETAVRVTEAGPEQSVAVTIPESLEMSNEENCDPNLQIVKVELVDPHEVNLAENMQSPPSSAKPIQAKSKCAIFPFLSDFLKAEETFRDKRRVEMISQSKPTQDKTMTSQIEPTHDKKTLTAKTRRTPEQTAMMSRTEPTPDRIMTSQSKSTPDKDGMTSQSKSTAIKNSMTSQPKTTPDKRITTSQSKAAQDKEGMTSESKSTPEKKGTKPQSKHTPDKKSMTSQSKSKPGKQVLASPHSESEPAKKMRIDRIETIESPTNMDKSEGSATDYPTKDQSIAETESEKSLNAGEIPSSGGNCEKNEDCDKSYMKTLPADTNFDAAKHRQLLEKFIELGKLTFELSRQHPT